METTSRFQLRLRRKIGRDRSPLTYLDQMIIVVKRAFPEFRGERMVFAKPDDFPSLCRYLFLAADSLCIDLGFAVRQKYPALCPYCDGKVCECGPVKPRPFERKNGPIPPEGTVTKLQEMILKIYPPKRHTLDYQVKKLLEEIEEAKTAIKNALLIEAQEELADIFARLAPLAASLGSPLL